MIIFYFCYSFGAVAAQFCHPDTQDEAKCGPARVKGNPEGLLAYEQ